MAISIDRLSGGNTPADGSDPRTFPAIWNATAAILEENVGTGGGGSITVSDTAPTDPAPENGDLWWNSADGKMFVYYVDGDSSQWVDAAGPSVAVQSTAPTGYEGQLWLDDTDGSMYVYYTDPGGGSSQWIGAVSRSGGILQVVSTSKTNTQSTSLATTATTAITDLTVTITPRSTSSKILLFAQVHASTTAVALYSGLSFTRNGTKIGIGDASGSSGRFTSNNALLPTTWNDASLAVPMQFLDAPSSVASVTYGVEVQNQAGSTQTVHINRTINGSTSASDSFRGISTITAIEVAG